MTSPVLTENFYTSAFLIREANGFLSRDRGSLINAGETAITYQGGLVVSLVTNEAATVTAGATNTGNGTFVSPAATSATAVGNYVLTMTSATEFSVVAPSGTALSAGTVGTAYSNSGVSFTLDAGSTAFVAGDTFTLSVLPAVNPQYTPFTGANTAAAILYNLCYVEAGQDKEVTVISRMAEVNRAELQWDPTVTESASVEALQVQALAALAAAGIVAR